MAFSEIKSFPLNPSLRGFSRLDANIPYADRPGCTLDLLLPWANQHQDELGTVRCPLVVFVQGSAWTTPDRGTEIPQLAGLSRKGYVVATVGHRSCVDGHRAPAFLADVKAAIRFLRAHAAEYSIDPQRVGIWGTSSGGNTALLVGLTAGDGRFMTDDYPDQSDGVNCVVDCFGPTDLEAMMDEDYAQLRDDPNTILAMLCGFPADEATRERMRLISPMRHVQAGRRLPPFMILHGTGDPVVNYSQSERLYRRLTDLGYDAVMYNVPEAPHEGGFWSEGLVEAIYDYLEEKLQGVQTAGGCAL